MWRHVHRSTDGHRQWMWCVFSFSPTRDEDWNKFLYFMVDFGYSPISFHMQSEITIICCIAFASIITNEDGKHFDNRNERRCMWDGFATNWFVSLAGHHSSIYWVNDQRKSCSVVDRLLVLDGNKTLIVPKIICKRTLI